MKKLYLLLLVFLLLFIPLTNAVTPYQLDHPIRELNGYTLREIFENRNMAMPDLTGKIEISSNIYRIINETNETTDYNVINGEFITNKDTSIASISINLNILEIGKQYTLSYYYISGLAQQIRIVQGTNSNENILINSVDYQEIHTITFTAQYTNLRFVILAFSQYDNLTFKLQIEKGSIVTPYQVPTNGPYNDIDIGEFNLTTEQIDMYYDYYLEAVQFEIDYYEAGLDPGEYQHIFKSILNGVKNLISEMGYLWQWLNAPIITSDMQDYSFNIDWSWDLIGVIRQIMNSAGILTLQIAFWVPSLAFAFMGIPIQISVLSLLFSNLIFLLLGWILVKSLLI